MKDLGCNPVGLDLIPRPPLVIEGDWHNLQFENDTFDMVYSNALDHVLYFDKFLSEIYRVLKSNGIVFFQIPLGQGTNPVGGECTSITTPNDIINFMSNFNIIWQGAQKRRGSQNYTVILRKGANK